MALDLLLCKLPPAVLFTPNIIVVTAEIPFLAVHYKQFIPVGMNAVNARVAFFYFFKNI